MNKRVLVGISGGIDSAVAAALLKTQGYEVFGAFLNMWPSKKDDLKLSGGSCCAVDSGEAAKTICEQLEVPFYNIDAHEAYQAQVLDYVVHEYLQARLPNPCVMCNSRVKFELLLKKADELKCDFVATGHYAKIVRNADGSETNLYQAADASSDQSYYLFGLRQEQLSRALMPVGDLLKANIRKMAVTFELPAIDRADTRNMCFVGEGGYKDLVLKRSSDRYRHAGPIVTSEGNILGRHTGLYQFAVGQSSGFSLTDPEHKNFVVLGFDLKMTALIVGPQEELKKKGLYAIECNWLGTQDFSHGLQAKAKVSPQSEELSCRITLLNNNSVLVDFSEPIVGIVPGQAIVFYQDDLVLGGGWIEALTEPVGTKLRVKGSVLAI